MVQRLVLVQSLSVPAHQAELGQQTQSGTPGGQSQLVPSLQSVLVVLTLRAFLVIMFHVREAGVFFFAIMFHVRGIAGQSLASGAQLMVSGQQTMSSGWPVGEVQQVPSSHTLPRQRPTPGMDLDKDFRYILILRNHLVQQAENNGWY